MENLKNQIIYFGNPNRFNDPYDCNLIPIVSSLRDDQVERIRSHYLNKTDISSNIFWNYLRSPLDDMRSLFERVGKSVLGKAIEDFPRSKGVSCFSERNNNILMWSHYADHHRGFCLEFDTSSEVFQKARPVKYSNWMPTIDLTPMICEGNFDQLIEVFCTKSVDWEYEREWRVVHSKGNTAYCYDADALTGVYFGSEVSNASVEIVFLILAGQNPSVKFWRGERSRTRFSVEFTPLTYTPYLEAKRLGLR